MAYEIKVTGGQVVDDAEKYVSSDGVLNEVAPVSTGAPVSDAEGFDTNPAEQVAYNWDGSEDDGTSYWDRFHTSKIKTWNPQSQAIEEAEVPTWQRAAKGLAGGLKSYGLTLLSTGGDKGKAWAAGIDKAFGDLDSEVAAQKKSDETKKNFDALVKDAKYTPASLNAYRRTGDPTKLVFENQIMSAKEASDAKLEVDKQVLEGKKFVYGQSQDLIKNAQDWKQLAISQQNADTSLLSARNSIIEIENPDEPGVVYHQQYDIVTQKPIGEPVRKGSKEARELQNKVIDEAKKDDAFMMSYDAENERIDELLKTDNKRLYEATEGRGLLDVASQVPGVGKTQAQKDRDYIGKLQSIQTLDQMKEVFGAMATDTDLAELKSTFANLDDARDTENFVKKVREIRSRNANRVRTSRAEVGLASSGKKLGRVVREAPTSVKEGDMFNNGQYIVVDGMLREVTNK